MSVNRVKAALQRITHLTNRQLWREYPEFMRFWAATRQEEEMIEMDTEIRQRNLEIVEQIKSERGDRP